jgi:hypothetical protein
MSYIYKVQALTIDLGGVGLSLKKSGDYFEVYEDDEQTAMFTAEQIKAVESLKALQDKYIAKLQEEGNGPMLEDFKNRYEAWKKDKTQALNVSDKEISKYYGAIKLTEFVTMALTDPGFQELLNSVTDETGKTFCRC